MSTQPQTKATIALVGLGNIGFRHLQGLKPIAGRIRLLGIDISPDNLARAKAEWGEGDAVFAGEPEAVTGPADVLILATSSNGRLELLRHWGGKLGARHVILEKVAFTQMAAFDAAAGWAQQAKASIVVNCPRRSWPLFERLREMLARETGPASLSYTDPNFGLACNGVHLIDIVQYLVGEPEIGTRDFRLDRIFESKRAGYKEVYGVFEAASPSGHRLTLSVREDEPADGVLRLRRGSLDLHVHQTTGRIETADGRLVDDVGRPPYQSELTGAIVDQLLTQGRCALASLQESATAHRALLAPLTTAFEAAGIDCRHGLPIT